MRVGFTPFLSSLHSLCYGVYFDFLQQLSTKSEIFWKSCTETGLYTILKKYKVQGCTKSPFPACVKMGWKDCVLLLAAGCRTQLFLLIFPEPGNHTLAHPCIYHLGYNKWILYKWFPVYWPRECNLTADFWFCWLNSSNHKAWTTINQSDSGSAWSWHLKSVNHRAWSTINQRPS